MERSRLLVRALIVVIAVVLGIPSAWAAEDTTGKVSIEAMSVAAGLGVTWGEGVLEFRGEKYPFTVSGFTIGDVGVAKVQAKGEVYNLKSVDDFAGVFAAAVAGGTFGGGAGAAAMKNQNGASMVWTSTSQGLNFSLAQAGMSVKLIEEGQYQATKNGRRAAADRQPAATPRTSP
jgi:ABC-type amino acid transport substrate-binding protein